MTLPPNPGVVYLPLNPGVAYLPLNPRVAYLPPNPRVAQLPPNPGVAQLPPTPGVAQLPMNPGVAQLPPNPRVAQLPPNPGVALLPPNLGVAHLPLNPRVAQLPLDPTVATRVAPLPPVAVNTLNHNQPPHPITQMQTSQEQLHLDGPRLDFYPMLLHLHPNSDPLLSKNEPQNINTQQHNLNNKPKAWCVNISSPASKPYSQPIKMKPPSLNTWLTMTLVPSSIPG